MAGERLTRHGVSPKLLLLGRYSGSGDEILLTRGSWKNASGGCLTGILGGERPDMDDGLEMKLGLVGSWVAGKDSEASREISYWAVRSEGACQARPPMHGIIGMAVEGRAGTMITIQIIQIPDPRRAGVSLGEVWLGLWEACRLEIAD